MGIAVFGIAIVVLLAMAFCWFLAVIQEGLSDEIWEHRTEHYRVKVRETLDIWAGAYARVTYYRLDTKPAILISTGVGDFLNNFKLLENGERKGDEK